MQLTESINYNMHHEIIIWPEYFISDYEKDLKIAFQIVSMFSDCSLSNSEDPDIWEYARTNNLVIVTFDSDFFMISV